MTVLKKRLNKTLKTTVFLLSTSLLIACQEETPVNDQAVVTEEKTAVVEQPAATTKPITAAIEEKVEAVVEEAAAIEEQVEAIVGQSAAAIEEKIEAVVEESAPIQELAQAAEIVKPKPPVDFSNLDNTKYTTVSEPFPVSSGDKIEVTELFWFGCGHCFALEPHLKSWIKSKPENTKFKKVPAIFSKRWEFHAKAFYTMEALNVPEQAYDDFFSQLHVKKKPINDINALATLLFRFGKDKTAVENAFNSFAVDSKVRNAIKITRASGARGVPAIVVDGKYLTSQSDAGGTPQMFEVVDQLIAKSTSER